MAEKKIGFIGLGTMGGAMCGHLQDAGLPVTVWARSTDKAGAALSAGAAWAESPAQLAEMTDVLILCVSNDDAVEEIVFRQRRCRRRQRSEQVLVDHSSIHPVTTREWSRS